MVDSKHQTWSYNLTSSLPNAGFAIVRGNFTFVGRAPFFKGFVVIRSHEQLDVVGVYTLKNVISSVPIASNQTPTTTTTTVSGNKVEIGKP